MAATKIVITHNFQRLTALFSGLGNKREIQQAIARSITRTIPAVQNVAFSEIRAKKILKLKASEVKQRARSYKNVGAGKAASEQYGKVWVTSQAESLGRFYAKKVRAGTSKLTGRPLFRAQVNSYGTPYLKNPDKSFIVKRGGGSVIFARVSGRRLPIEKLYGPGMSELVQQTGIINTMARVASERYQKEFEHNVRFYADRAVQKAKGK